MPRPELEFVLVRRRGRRGVGLRVDGRGLTVSAPVTMPLARIESVVLENESWILRKISEWSGRKVPAAQWHEGAAVPFLGQALTLRIATRGRAGVERRGDELHVAVRDASAGAIERAVVRWFKAEAREYLASCVTHLAAAAGLAPPRFVLSSARSRWGSCNTRREVRLAWRLMKASPAHVNYVICHELAHLVHMNHSRAFWAEVARQCPDYRRLRDELLAVDHLYRSF
jgi:predicted metal-dependent hydrolase